MTRQWNPYSAGKRTRWQDDAGEEYLIPSTQTTGFRCIIMDMRRPPLLYQANGDIKPMSMARWGAWQPKLRKAFRVLYGEYQVPKEKRTGKGKKVQCLKRYQKNEDKYRAA